MPPRCRGAQRGCRGGRRRWAPQSYPCAWGTVRVGHRGPPPPVKRGEFLIFPLSGFTCSEGSQAGDPGPGRGAECTQHRALPPPTNNQK